MIKQSHIFFTISSVAFVFYACQPNPKPQEEVTNNETDSIILDTLEIQKQFHPEAPEHFVFDTTFKVGKKTYSVHTEDMTINNSFVSFMDDYQGNKLMNIYLNRKFILNIKKDNSVLFSDTILKEKYSSEYIENNIERTILHDLHFKYYDDDAKEFVFNFNLSQPNTDYSDIVIYKVDKLGKSKHEIEVFD